jgi:DNA-binding winged helix-turn-helix (wHTH) protein/TolB-like protein
MQQQFGLFTFDSETRELTRNGAPVRLEPQPALVLSLLIEKAGAVVTRDELRRAVWGDTFVDFDRGLNYAIAQIRTALGDSATSPRFIRTIPKTGYEFIAPVTNIADLVPPHRRARKLLIALAAAVVLSLPAVVWRMVFDSRPVVVAVARFDNETGSDEFDRSADLLTDNTVADMTDIGGRVRPRCAIIGNALILRQPRERRDLSAVAAQLRARYAILGQVQRSGTKIRLLAHLIRLPEQTHVYVYRRELSPSELLGSESDLAGKMSWALIDHLSSSSRPLTH